MTTSTQRCKEPYPAADRADETQLESARHRLANHCAFSEPSAPIVDGTASEFDDASPPDFAPTESALIIPIIPPALPQGLPLETQLRQSRFMRRRQQEATAQ
jgi:hypothetical protein